MENVFRLRQITAGKLLGYEIFARLKKYTECSTKKSEKQVKTVQV
jgi:hypothetical protein